MLDKPKRFNYNVVRDAQKFKKEYEALNGQSNDAGVLHKTIEISENNPMIYATDEEVIQAAKTASATICFV